MKLTPSLRDKLYEEKFNYLSDYDINRKEDVVKMIEYLKEDVISADNYALDLEEENKELSRKLRKRWWLWRLFK